MMRTSIRSLGILIPVLVVASAYSKPTTQSAHPKTITEAQAEQQLVDGLIINRTITVLGWNFYQAFTAVWNAKYGNQHFPLVIYERPTARWGSEIWINYGQARVFHTFLPPAMSRTNTIAKTAVDTVHQAATDIKVQRALYSDIDLAPEEM